MKALQTRQCSAAATMPAGIGKKSTFMRAKTFSKEAFFENLTKEKDNANLWWLKKRRRF